MINLIKRTKEKVEVKNQTKIIFKRILILLIILMLIFITLNKKVYSTTGEIIDSFQEVENSSNSILDDVYTSTTVESITSGLSDEALSFTNLLLIVLISVNIVLLLLAIIILMQINKKI